MYPLIIRYGKDPSASTILSGEDTINKMPCRSINIRIIKKESPMKLFTLEESQPSQKTLNMIRQIAYTYRVIQVNGKNEAYCLN